MKKSYLLLNLILCVSLFSQSTENKTKLTIPKFETLSSYKKDFGLRFGSAINNQSGHTIEAGVYYHLTKEVFKGYNIVDSFIKTRVKKKLFDTKSMTFRLVSEFQPNTKSPLMINKLGFFKGELILIGMEFLHLTNLEGNHSFGLRPNIGLKFWNIDFVWHWSYVVNENINQLDTSYCTIGYNLKLF